MKPMAHPPMDDVTLPAIFYALGDEERLKIIRNLYASNQPLTCIDAVRGIENLPISTRSHCFRILRESGLIRSEKKGRECYNSLRFDELNKKFPNFLKSVLDIITT